MGSKHGVRARVWIKKDAYCALLRKEAMRQELARSGEDMTTLWYELQSKQSTAEAAAEHTSAACLHGSSPVAAPLQPQLLSCCTLSQPEIHDCLPPAITSSGEQRLHSEPPEPREQADVDTNPAADDTDASSPLSSAASSQSQGSISTSTSVNIIQANGKKQKPATSRNSNLNVSVAGAKPKPAPVGINYAALLAAKTAKSQQHKERAAEEGRKQRAAEQEVRAAAHREQLKREEEAAQNRAARAALQREKVAEAKEATPPGGAVGKMPLPKKASAVQKEPRTSPPTKNQVASCQEDSPGCIGRFDSVPMEPDGSCLKKHGLDNGLTASELRHQMCVMVLKCKKPIANDSPDTLQDWVAKDGFTPKSYVQRQSKPSSWGGALEMMAFAMRFGFVVKCWVPASIVDPYQYRLATTFIATRSKPSQVLNVVFERQAHYNVLVSANDIQNPC